MLLHNRIEVMQKDKDRNKAKGSTLSIRGQTAHENAAQHAKIRLLITGSPEQPSTDLGSPRISIGR
jgi:hypothetical protein